MKNILYLICLISISFFSCKKMNNVVRSVAQKTYVIVLVTCPDDSFKFNESCVTKQNGSYIGNLECGCFDDLILTIWPDLGTAGIKSNLQDGGVNLTSLGDNKYQFYFFRECNLDTGISDFIDFNVEILSDGLQVDADWVNLGSGEVIETCSSLFTP